MRGPDLPDYLRPFVAEQSPLWPLTTMRVGGPARWLAQPKTCDDLTRILDWVREYQIPHMLLGGGANIIFPSDGYRGAVVRVRKLNGLRIEGTTVTAACGESLSDVAHQLAQLGLTGMEWACGIPGTVGGAIVMNAGVDQADVATILSSVRIHDADGIRDWPASDLALVYRSSALRDGRLRGAVVEATFALQHDDPQHCLDRESEFIASRRRTQPSGASSGCIFKNPKTGPSAGELIDRAGCKGLRIGDARVSDLHANFILNEGKNNAADVLELIAQLRERVFDVHGIELDLEVVIPTVPPA